MLLQLETYFVALAIWVMIRAVPHRFSTFRLCSYITAKRPSPDLPKSRLGICAQFLSFMSDFPLDLIVNFVFIPIDSETFVTASSTAYALKNRICPALHIRRRGLETHTLTHLHKMITEMAVRSDRPSDIRDREVHLKGHLVANAM